MRSRLLQFVWCLLAAGCSNMLELDFPPYAIAASPPPQYRVWWEVVERCSGRTAPFDAVTWYRIPIGTGLSVKGKSTAGAWYTSGNRIAIGDGWRESGSLVRHEMLHAILQTGSHPDEQFRGRCQDEVRCGRDCVSDVPLPGAIPLPVERLEVEAELFPREPSFRVHQGRTVIVVRVRNPTTSSVFVPSERFSQASCPVGFRVASVSDPLRYDLECRYLAYNQRDARVYFRPGETRRLVFEVDLRRPTPGGAFLAEEVTLSAILVGTIREMRSVVLRP